MKDASYIRLNKISCISLSFSVLRASLLRFRFYWHRTNSFLGESIATIIWDIPVDAKPGRYRIRHFGAAKSLLQQVTK